MATASKSLSKPSSRPWLGKLAVAIEDLIRELSKYGIDGEQKDGGPEDDRYDNTSGPQHFLELWPFHELRLFPHPAPEV